MASQNVQPIGAVREDLIVTKYLSIVLGGLALFLSALFAMRLGGMGPLGARLSVGSLGGAVAAGVAVAWLGGALLQTRWLAAILFSLPMALFLVLACISQQWWRGVALLACMVLPFVVVGRLRFDRRQSRYGG